MSTQVAKTQSQPLTIRDHITGDKFKQAVAAALPKHLTPERFIRVALTAFTKTPKLMDCDQPSLFASLLTLSQLGLEPDGRRAHLIPYGKTCQLIIDYKGLAELAMRSGAVSYLHADVVCENDLFEYDKGQLTTHKIDFKQPRGDVYAVYALCKFKDGGEKCEVMTRDEVEAIRKRSRAKDSGPWVTDWNEMAKKTVFRRLSKWLPLSPEFMDAIDNDADNAELQRFNAAKVAVSSEPVFAAQIQEPEAPIVEAPQAPVESDGELAPQYIVAKTLESHGVSFTDFQCWLITTGLAANADTFGSMRDLPEKLCKTLLADGQKQLQKCVTIYGKQ